MWGEGWGLTVLESITHAPKPIATPVRFAGTVFPAVYPLVCKTIFIESSAGLRPNVPPPRSFSPAHG